MSRWERRRARHGADEGGAIAVVVALMSVIVLVAAGLALDFGRAWASRGEAQNQADKAAVAGASGLPVAMTGSTKTATQLVAAKYATYHLLCNPIQGQQALTGPTCSPSLTAQSSTLDALAARLLANGVARKAGSSTYNRDLPAISFPAANKIEVAAAQATTEFMLGSVTGAKQATTIKSATAQLSSPGAMLPIGLATDSTSLTSGGLGCLTGQSTSAQSYIPEVGDRNMSLIAGAGYPLPVVSVGRRTPDASGFAYPTGYPRSGESIRTSAEINGIAIFPRAEYEESISVAQGTSIKLNLSGKDFNPVASFVERRLVFFNPATGGVVWGPDTVALADAPALDTYLIGQDVPTSVTNTAGIWWVTVYMRQTTLGSNKWWTPAAEAASIQIIDPVESFTRYDLHGCAKYLSSPRKDTSNAVTTGVTSGSSTMVRNLVNGLDHGIGLNPGANNLTCAGRQNVDGTIYDDSANLVAGYTPNCVTVAAKVSTPLEVTKGWLGAPPGDATGAVTGRLDCTYVMVKGHSNCGSRTFSMWGRTYNNDRLRDFIVGYNLTTTPHAFAQDAYSGDGIPLITPATGSLKQDIYYSPRLFWAPLVSTVAGQWNANPDGQQVRVLGYRPVFITQSAADGSQDIWSNWCLNNTTPGIVNKGMNPVAAEYRDPAGNWSGVHVNGVSRARTSEEGICLTPGLGGVAFKQFRNPTRLQGLQFQTIAPRTMPEVPADYDGPLTDYVGTGPRVVRLVK